MGEVYEHRMCNFSLSVCLSVCVCVRARACVRAFDRRKSQTQGWHCGPIATVINVTASVAGGGRGGSGRGNTPESAECPCASHHGNSALFVHNVFLCVAETLRLVFCLKVVLGKPVDTCEEILRRV